VFVSPGQIIEELLFHLSFLARNIFEHFRISNCCHCSNAQSIYFI